MSFSIPGIRTQNGQTSQWKITSTWPSFAFLLNQRKRKNDHGVIFMIKSYRNVPEAPMT